MQSVLYEQLAVLVPAAPRDTSYANLRKWRMERHTDHVHPLSRCSATATAAEPIWATTAATWSSVQRTDADRRNRAVLHSGYAGAGP